MAVLCLDTKIVLLNHTADYLGQDRLKAERAGRRPGLGGAWSHSKILSQKEREAGKEGEFEL